MENKEKQPRNVLRADDWLRILNPILILHLIVVMVGFVAYELGKILR